MDQILKARKMSSASARRRKMLAREEEEFHAQELYIQRKKRIVLYDHLADEPPSPSGSESTTDAEDHQHNRQDSVSSPSESSVATPNETSSTFTKTASHHIEASLSERPQLHLLLPGSPMDAASVHQPSPAPKLQASLVALTDFTYDRYSMILETPKPVASPTEIVSTPELEFDDYSPSPVEIATPISISLPKARPAVISISPRSNKKRRTITAQSPLSQAKLQSPPPPPPPPPRSSRRLSQGSMKSGFLASEASLMHVPDLPENASSKIARASRESVAWYGSQDEKNAMQRKSSQPLLSAIKTSHARMSSIKSLIRSPTHQESSSISSSRPESRSCRTPTSVADVMNDEIKPFETVPADFYDAPKPRPHTSYRPSRPSISSKSSRQLSVTALPIVPTAMPEPASQMDDAASRNGSMRRNKSFSNLRKRSESIGQAIKTAATKTISTAGHTPKLSQQFSASRRDMFPPDLPQPPMLKPHHTKSSVELSAFPTPPLPSPSPHLNTRNRKTVAGYSMFPSTPRLGADRKSSIGLGLGLKV